MDERIGTRREDGSVETWPAVTLTGRTYLRPVSTTRLSARHFCIVDNDLRSISERDELLAALKEQARELEGHRDIGRRHGRAADNLDAPVPDAEE